MKINNALILLLLVTAMACSNNPTSTALKDQADSTLEKTSGQEAHANHQHRYTDERDAALNDYIDPRKAPADSIAKWNAEVLAAKKAASVSSDQNTQQFSIDAITGELSGCPLLAFEGTPDFDKVAKERTAFRNRFDQIKPKLRPAIMKSVENEFWYGDPKNVEITGDAEAIHAGIGPVGFSYNKANTRLVVPVGYPHGGDMNAIYFFNSEGEPLSNYQFEVPLTSPLCYLNAEETYVAVCSNVMGDFYFFDLDGKLIRKGSFEKVTGDFGNSFGRAVISEKGKYWVLQNNLSYVYQGEQLISKVNGHNLFVDEKNDRLIYLEGRDKIVIQNLTNGTLEYLLAQENIRVLNITGKNIYIQSLINNKIYTYAIN